MGPEVIRSLERILGVLIGGFSVYLGFRLFLALPEKTDSSGKLIFPGGTNIYLSRIGPGVFFALFGCAIVAVSFQQQVRVESRPTPTSPSDTIGYVYIGSNESISGSDGRDETRLADVRTSLGTLNQLAYPVLVNLHSSERNSLRLALEHSKRLLIRSVWRKDWGSFDAFDKWVEEGQAPPLPSSVRPEALEVFNSGLPGR